MLITPAASFDRTVTPFPVTVKTMQFGDVLALGDDLADVDLLVIPLIGEGFDAFDLLHQLGATVFMGRVRVVSERLPDRAMVLGELRAVADPLGLTVDLIDCAQPHLVEAHHMT
jgi:hypothetical protein